MVGAGSLCDGVGSSAAESAMQMDLTKAQRHILALSIDYRKIKRLVDLYGPVITQ